MVSMTVKPIWDVLSTILALQSGQVEEGPLKHSEQVIWRLDQLCMGADVRTLEHCLHFTSSSRREESFWCSSIIDSFSSFKILICSSFSTRSCLSLRSPLVTSPYQNLRTCLLSGSSKDPLTQATMFLKTYPSLTDSSTRWGLGLISRARKASTFPRLFDQPPLGKSIMFFCELTLPYHL